MEYFAGLFDAEGYVTIGNSGAFRIGTEMAIQEIPNILMNNFGGHIYVRKRDKRKKTWSWVISDRESSMNFIDLVACHSIIKRTQLLRLYDYLDSSRETRNKIRSQIVHQMSNLKKPLPLIKEHINVPSNNIPDTKFWKWLAGFFDGDGNFCVYEYQGKKSIIFDSWISVFNTFPESIEFVKRHINGSISKYKGAKFPIWKWVCCQKDSELVCESVLPFLRVKKEQCKLVMEFLEIKKTKTRETSYSFENINRIREIIKQIKHLNSL